MRITRRQALARAAGQPAGTLRTELAPPRLAPRAELVNTLEIMQRELVDAAAAAGRPTRASIDASVVRTRFV